MGYVVNAERRLTVAGLPGVEVDAIVLSTGEQLALSSDMAAIKEDDRYAKLIKPTLAGGVVRWNLERQLPDGTVEPVPVTPEGMDMVPIGILMSIWRAFTRSGWEVPEDSPLPAASTSGESFLAELEAMARSSSSQQS